MPKNPDRYNYEPVPSFQIHEYGATSLRKLQETGQIPERKYLPDGLDIYRQLLDSNLQLYKSELSDGSQELFVFGDPVAGEQLNGLLYFPAPSRRFDFDTDDILKDWIDLYEKPENARRLAAHRTIPGWDVFETERLPIWESLFRYAHFQPLYEEHFFIPVLAWKRLPNGSSDWVVDASELHSLSAVKRQFEKTGKAKYFYHYSTLVGSLLAATFASDVTKAWPPRLNYQLKESDMASQNMGATQSLPLVLAKSQELLRSRFVIQMEKEFGLIPTLTPIDELEEVETTQADTTEEDSDTVDVAKMYFMDQDAIQFALTYFRTIAQEVTFQPETSISREVLHALKTNIEYFRVNGKIGEGMYFHWLNALNVYEMENFQNLT